MAEWPGSVIVIGKDTTPTNPTLNLDTFTKAGFAKNADGSGYTITVPEGACAIEVASNGIIIPTENTIVVGKDKTLFIDFPDVDNTGVRMSAEARNPYGLTIEGGLDIDARGGLLYWSDGIVYVSEQKDTSEDAEKIHLTVTEAMNVNVKDLDIEGYGYGVGITEGNFEVGSDGSKDFNLSMTGIHNRYQGDDVNLYALELGDGYDKANVDRTYKFHGNLNINALQFTFKANGSDEKQGDVYIYGVSLDTSADEKTGADTMTVDKTLTIQDVSAGADASRSEAYGFYASERGDSNAFVTVEQATEVSHIKATTNSGAGVCATGVRVDNVPQLIQTGVERIENEDGTVTRKPIFASEAPNAGNVEITLKGGLTIQDVSASGGKDGGANEGADLAEEAEKAKRDPDAENVLTNSEAYGLAVYGMSVYEAYGQAYGQSVSEIKATQVSDATVTVEGATKISGISATTDNGKKSGAETYAAGIEVGTDENHTATLNLNGDVTIEKVSASGGSENDAYAVKAFNNATVNINAAASADKTVVVSGDLGKENVEEKMTQVCVDGSNAKVVMNLCNAGSAFYGYTTTGKDVDDSSAIDMTLSNGGTWYVAGDNRLQGTLTMGNQGVVDMSAYRREGKETFVPHTLTVDTLTGKDGVFEVKVDTAKATADHVVINSGSGAHKLTVTNVAATGSDKDILVVTRHSGDATFTLGNAVEAGNYSYTLKSVGDAVGSCEFFLTPDALTPSSQTSLSMAPVGAAYSAYLSNLGNLRSRMGEVRRHAGRKGVWAQVNFWKDRADSFAVTSYSQDVMALSAGYDVKPSKRWIVGLGLSAGIHDMKGNQPVGRATGDANSFFVNPYGTWTHKNGTYVDIVGSVGVFDQDFNLYRFGQPGMNGDFTDFGAGLSVEVGRKFSGNRRAPRVVDAKGASVSTVRQPEHGWFVEPQAQLSFYNVFADDYTTNDGSHAQRDDVQALTGRLGLVVGKDFAYGANKKGQVYVKGGYIHEFCGDQEAKLNGESFSEDTVLGSRFYYGIGVDMELRHNLNVYGEVGREEGAHYTREYDVRCGIKFTY